MNFWSFKICLVSTIFGFIWAFDDYPLSLTIMKYAWLLSDASNQFGFNLLSELVTDKSDNVVLSPISISTTFGLIYFGTEGRTKKALETILGYKSANLNKTELSLAFQFLLSHQLITEDSNLYSLDLANALFVNENLNLNPTYKTAAEEYFLSSVENANFVEGRNAVGKINELVRNKTNGKICGIIDSLDSTVDLVAVNALYFKSQWFSDFSVYDTKAGIFYNGGKVAKTVRMMKLEEFFQYYQDDELAMVQMGFRGENLSMVILLPRKKDGLLDMEKKFTTNKLIRIIYGATMKPVVLTVPKFNITYSNDLGPSMQKLGAIDIFHPGLADFSNMIKEKGISIGEVRHKTVVDVNESGVEASSVTASISFRSAPIGHIATRLTVDHPFMFMILDDRTNLVILVGRVWNL